MLIIALTAVFLRLLVVLVIREAPSTWEYQELATSILQGRGYVLSHLGTDYRSYYSGWPYVGLTAAIRWIFPSNDTVILIAQAVISGTMVASLIVLGRSFLDERAALVAGLLAATHPGLLYYDTHNLHPLGFDTALTVVSVLILVRFSSRSPRWDVARGVVLGLAVLQRFSLLPLVLVGAWWIARPWRWKRTLVRRVTMLAVGASLAPALWLARNYSLHGQLLFSTTSGEHFWIGNCGGSKGSATLPSGEVLIDRLPCAARARLDQVGELEQSRLFWMISEDCVRASPTEILRGVAVKFLRFWTYSPQAGVNYPRHYAWGYLAYFAVVAMLAGVGLRLVLQKPRAVRAVTLIAFAFLSVSIVHAVFYFEMRHRWALEPLLLLFAGAGLVGIVGGRPLRPGSRH